MWIEVHSVWVAQTTTVLTSYPGSFEEEGLAMRLLLCNTGVCVHVAVSSGGTYTCMLK